LVVALLAILTKDDVQHHVKHKLDFDEQNKFLNKKTS
jgi:hypothetical protein